MNTLACLNTYNRICRGMDAVYHAYAKSCGLSDSAFWILYSLAEEAECFTQSAFSGDWFFAPQTVNSAIKELIKKDIVYLEPVRGNKKNSLIKPTANGKKFIERFMMPVIKSECESFGSLSAEECELMLEITKKYMSELADRVGAAAKANANAFG